MLSEHESMTLVSLVSEFGTNAKPEPVFGNPVAALTNVSPLSSEIAISTVAQLTGD
jgi:hypothetical protein